MFAKTHVESQHSVFYAPNKLSLKRKHASRIYVRTPLKIPHTRRKISFIFVMLFVEYFSE
jgi:hypothetical protein